jgi:hypothetical protein
MRHRKRNANDRRAEEAEREIQVEPFSSVGPGIPGMNAAMGFATDVFATWMVGLMTMPIELAPAIGCSAIQAINGGGSGAPHPRRSNRGAPNG